MKQNFELRHAVHPDDFKSYGTQKLRDHFAVTKLMVKNQVNMVYTMYDRYICGGAVPVGGPLNLKTVDALKADYFLERRELGIINVGGKGSVEVDGKKYALGNMDALYVGRGNKKIVFKSRAKKQPAKFYFNSAPAHHAYPSKLIKKTDADVVKLGSLETSNARTIYKLIVNSVVKTCQLQMGLTELEKGSVWNTMPAHTHNRRMEIYFYFNLPKGQSACHFMGQPQETRHLFLQNEEAAISPPWSIHAGSGTSNYAFIWGMCGENLDYGDMDMVSIPDLR
ncbi:MAG TPA: 5-dehydro-4-deoxy-D-glucuronate isomerase [Bacteroidetes bacterium]|nr:5-dehydro-4-deoxy-D-glucuronate isomerase [Bacteroidota bacterium]